MKTTLQCNAFKGIYKVISKLNFFVQKIVFCILALVIKQS